jgi:hypothetical protein
MLRVFRDGEWQDRGLLDDPKRGRILFAIYLHHVRRRSGNVRRAAVRLHNEFFGYMTDEDVSAVLSEVEGAQCPHRFTHDKMAQWFGITNADRIRLGLTAFGAIDFPKAARTARRKSEARKRDERARRARGVQTLADSKAVRLLSQTRKPNRG